MKYFLGSMTVLSLLFAGIPSANAQSPTITVFSNLTFGMSLGNTSNTVAPSDPGAASFLIQVPGYSMVQYGYSDISVSISLPYSLKSGKNSMNVSYGSNSGAWNNTNSLSGATFFSPSSGIYQQLYPNTPLNLYVWIGGTATPGGSWQPSGVYTGSIDVTVKITVDSKPKQKFTLSQTIPVTATVIQGLSMTATGSLDFGMMVAGTTPPSLSALSGSAPEFTTAGSGGSGITVKYPSTVSLQDAYGNTLTFTPSLLGASVSTNQSGATAVPSQSMVTLSGTSGQTGYYYFWLGGSIAHVPGGQPSGSYSGTFTLTVNY